MSRRFAHILILLIVTAFSTILLGKLIVNDHEYDPVLYSYGIIVTFAIGTLIGVRYRYYRDPYELATTLLPELPTPQPLVSIMVAAYNEEAFINRCVDSLIAQDYGRTEVIVVNDCSTDGTAAALAKYETMPHVQVVHLPTNAGKKRALAEAMLRAQGSLFVFTDSDSTLAHDAVRKAVHIFAAFPDVGAVSGHTRAQNASVNLLTRIQDTWYEGQFSVRKAYESVFGSVTCVSGPFAAFRRSAVFNLIPFWINDTFLGSEFRFATDRTKTGLVLAHEYFTPQAFRQFPQSPFVTREQHPPRRWRVVYANSIHALTNVPESIHSFLRQQVRWKKSFIRNIFLTGRFYWQRPLPAAIMYYLRAVFVFVGPFIVFRHLVWLPLNGDLYTAALYLSGILFVGCTFATLHKIERPNENGWVYRPLMNLISTFVLSWLIFYSLATIKKMTWYRGT